MCMQTFRYLLLFVIFSFCSSQLFSAQTKVKLEQIATGMGTTLLVESEPGNASRLYVLDQDGRIFLIKDGVKQTTPFLDIRSLTNRSGERGLLGLAFHPNYSQNGYFYINFTDNSGDTQISRYQVTTNPDVVSTSTRFDILNIDQPYSNHNGGCIRFGPDGYLYIATGDGGSAGDPRNYAQNGNSLLGKMLRIDIDSTTGQLNYSIPSTNPFITNSSIRDEIWAIGLRNPWRFNFDSLTGDMYIADVGQNAWEYVHFEPAGDPGGRNYGWKIVEGSNCYSPSNGCNKNGLEMPIYEYAQTFFPTKCCIIGSEVYRGKSMARMQGRYFFSDACSQDLWSFRYNSTNNSINGFIDHTSQSGAQGSATSLGSDADGEVYICRGGTVYKLIPAEMYLKVPPLQIGTQSIVTVTQATPNSPVYLAYSLRGMGNTVIPQLGVSVSLNSPALAATSSTNASGAANYTLLPPPQLFGRTVWLQAVQNGATSNVFEVSF